MTAQILKLPEQPAAQDIPAALRHLADCIERGDYGHTYNLAWAIDCGHRRVEVGLLGPCAEPSTALYYLLGLAKRRVEGAAYG